MSLQQRFSGEWLSRQRHQSSHGRAIPGHGQDLAGDHAVHHLTALVAQVPDRHICHVAKRITGDTSSSTANELCGQNAIMAVMRGGMPLNLSGNTLCDAPLIFGD